MIEYEINENIQTPVTYHLKITLFDFGLLYLFVGVFA